ncbi:hypothetical protein FRC03_011672 [Tulasnella sp. 419]|nr:hypothetical protein FRC03_011672 [Tulasnella sp. 419]
MPQPQPGQAGIPQGLGPAQNTSRPPLGAQAAANVLAQQQLVQPPQPPQTPQQQIPRPNSASGQLPDLSHLQAWPGREQLAQADTHIQLLLREAVRQRDLERPIPHYDIPASQDMLFNQKFQEICAIAMHLKQRLAPFYVFSPKEENALKVAIRDLVRVMEQQKMMKSGQKVYLFSLQELDMISARWKKLLMYHTQLLRAAEKLPGFPQPPQQQQQQPPQQQQTQQSPFPQQQQPMPPPPAAMPKPPSQPHHPNVGVEQPAPVNLQQSFMHNNAQFAQHSSPPADSLPSTKQPQLQPSAIKLRKGHAGANGVASSPSPALAAATPPNVAPTPTAAADSPKTPKSPVVTNKGSKGKQSAKGKAVNVHTPPAVAAANNAAAKRRPSIKNTDKMAHAEVNPAAAAAAMKPPQADHPMEQAVPSTNGAVSGKRPRESENQLGEQPGAGPSSPKRPRVDQMDELEKKRAADVAKAEESSQSAIAFLESTEGLIINGGTGEADKDDRSLFEMLADLSKMFDQGGMTGFNNLMSTRSMEGFPEEELGGDVKAVKHEEDVFDFSWAIDEKRFTQDDIGETPDLTQSVSSQGPTPNSDGEGDLADRKPLIGAALHASEGADYWNKINCAGAPYYSNDSDWSWQGDMKDDGASWPIIIPEPTVSGST